MFHKCSAAPLVLAGALALATPLGAAPGIVDTVAPGYSVTMLDFTGESFGSVGRHPSDPDRLITIFYDSMFSALLYEIDLSTPVPTVTPAGDITSVAVFPGGITFLDDNTIAWVDNGAGADDVFVATDGDMSGTWDAGEITTLTALGLTLADATGQADFTGSHLRVVPTGSTVTGLQAGDVLVQTADDANNSEAVLIRNLTGTPSFVPAPAGIANVFWRDAFDYDGGFGFGPSGTLLMSALENDFATPKITAARDVNSDGSIDPVTESNIISTLNLGGGYCIDANQSGTILVHALDKIHRIDIGTGDPLLAAPASSSTVLVDTADTSFLSLGVFSSEALPFDAFGDPGTSAAYVFSDFFGSALYIVRPDPGSSVPNWREMN